MTKDEKLTYIKKVINLRLEVLIHSGNEPELNWYGKQFDILYEEDENLYFKTLINLLNKRLNKMKKNAED